MSLHRIETFTRHDDKHGWKICVGDDVVAFSTIGFDTEAEMLDSLFGIFLGTWDLSFLGLYQKWQDGLSRLKLPDDSPPVRIAAEQPPVVAAEVGERANE